MKENFFFFLWYVSVVLGIGLFILVDFVFLFFFGGIVKGKYKLKNYKGLVLMVVFLGGGGGGRGGGIWILNIVGLRFFLVGLLSFCLFFVNGEIIVGGWVISNLCLFLVSVEVRFGGWISVSFSWRFFGGFSCNN